MPDTPEPFLSIVIPAYNEEPNIASTLEDIATYLEEKTYSCEVIVVDDGSSDKTAEIALATGKLFDDFTLLRNPRNIGKGDTVKRGVLESKGDYVLFMDADNATRISHLDEFLSAARNGYDVVIGSRKLKNSQVKRKQPFIRRALGEAYIMLSGIILGTRVKDYNCGFKLFRQDAARKLFSRLARHDWSFDSELIFLAGKFALMIKELPVTWEDRKTTSKVRPLRDGLNSFFSLLAIRKNFRQS